MIPWQNSSAYGIYGPEVAKLAWAQGFDTEEDAKSQYSTASEGTSWKKEAGSPPESSSHSQSRHEGTAGGEDSRPSKEVVANGGEKEEGELEEGEIVDDDLEPDTGVSLVSSQVVGDARNRDRPTEAHIDRKVSTGCPSRSPVVSRRSRSPEQRSLRRSPNRRGRSRSPNYRRPNGHNRSPPFRHRSRERDRWRRERSRERRGPRSRSRERSGSRGPSSMHHSKGGGRLYRERALSREADNRRERANSKGGADVVAEEFRRRIDRLKEDKDAARQSSPKDLGGRMEVGTGKEQAQGLQDVEELAGKVTVKQAMISLAGVCQDLEAALARLQKAADTKVGTLSQDGIQKVADEVFFGIRTAYIVGTTGAGRNQDKGKDGIVLSLIRRAHTNSRFFTSKQSKELEAWLIHLTTKASESKPSPAVSASNAKEASVAPLPQGNTSSGPPTAPSKTSTPSASTQTPAAALSPVVQDSDLAQPHLDALKRNALAYAQGKRQQAGPSHPTPRVGTGGSVHLFIPPSLPSFPQNPPPPPSDSGFVVDPPQPPGFGEPVAPPGFQLPSRPVYLSTLPAPQPLIRPEIQFPILSEYQLPGRSDVHSLPSAATQLSADVRLHRVPKIRPSEYPKIQFSLKTHGRAQQHMQPSELIEEAFSDEETQPRAIPLLETTLSGSVDAPPGFKLSVDDARLPTGLPLARPLVLEALPVSQAPSTSLFEALKRATNALTASAKLDPKYNPFDTDDDLPEATFEPPGFAPPGVMPAGPMAKLADVLQAGRGVQANGPAVVSSGNLKEFERGVRSSEVQVKPPGFGGSESERQALELERGTAGEPGKQTGEKDRIEKALEDEKQGGKRARSRWEDAEEAARDAKRGSAERMVSEKEPGESQGADAVKSETLNKELVRRLKEVTESQSNGGEVSGVDRGKEAAGGSSQPQWGKATAETEGGEGVRRESPRGVSRSREEETRLADSRARERERGRRTASPRREYRRGSGGRDERWWKDLRARGRRGSYGSRSPPRGRDGLRRRSRDRGRSRSREETRRRDSDGRGWAGKGRESPRRREGRRRYEGSRSRSPEKERQSKGRESSREPRERERRETRRGSTEEETRRAERDAPRHLGAARSEEGVKSRGDQGRDKSPLAERKVLDREKDERGRPASHRESSADRERHGEQKGVEGKKDRELVSKAQGAGGRKTQKAGHDRTEAVKPAVLEQRPNGSVNGVALPREKDAHSAAAVGTSERGTGGATKGDPIVVEVKLPASSNGNARVDVLKIPMPSRPSAPMTSHKSSEPGLDASRGASEPSRVPVPESAPKTTSKPGVAASEGRSGLRASSPAESTSGNAALIRAASPMLSDSQAVIVPKPTQPWGRLEASLLGRPPKAPPEKEVKQLGEKSVGATKGAEDGHELSVHLRSNCTATSTADSAETEMLWAPVDGAESGEKKGSAPTGKVGKVQSGNKVNSESGGFWAGSNVETAALSNGLGPVGKLPNGILKKPASVVKVEGPVAGAGLFKSGVLKRQGSGSVSSGAPGNGALTGPVDLLEAKIKSDPQVEALLSGMDEQRRAVVEAERVRRLGEQARMVANKKLCLVLDLDHTLLNSATFAEIDKAGPDWSTKLDAKLVSEIAACRADPGRPRELHRFPELLMWTKLRPGVATFLKKASQLFELHVYTMGNTIYATRMAQLLDPTGAYFAGRIISKGDALDAPLAAPGEIPASLRSKDLDGVLGMESCVLIIDDSAKVWPHHFHNLIVVERYMYFPGSRQQFGQKGEGLFELRIDEDVHDGMLASATRVIEQVHGDFFRAHQAGGESAIVDARDILQKIQRSVLQGVRIVFSRVFPQGTAHPEQNVKWRMAEQFGATCTLTLDDAVTHVVAAALGTDKVHWALKNNRSVVSPYWLEASAILYKRANESQFPPADPASNAKGVGSKPPE